MQINLINLVGSEGKDLHEDNTYIQMLKASKQNVITSFDCFLVVFWH